MVQRLLRSWSRKELGDSEPFGLLLMLVKVSVLASLKQRIYLLLRDTPLISVQSTGTLMRLFLSKRVLLWIHKNALAFVSEYDQMCILQDETGAAERLWAWWE